MLRLPGMTTKSILAFAGALALAGCAHSNSEVAASSDTGSAFDDAYASVKTGAKKTVEAGEWVVDKTGDGAVRIYRWGKEQVAGAGEASSDSFITAQVKARLATDSDTSARNIHVSTDAGVVTLQGTVRSRHEAARAIRDTLDVKGVMGINDELFLQSASR